MEGLYQEYEFQVKKATETLQQLELKLATVKLSLTEMPEDSHGRRQLKQLMLDLTITANELEHAQSALEKHKKK